MNRIVLSPTRLADQMSVQRYYGERIEACRRQAIAGLGWVGTINAGFVLTARAVAASSRLDLIVFAIFTLAVLLTLLFMIAAAGREANDLVAHHGKHHFASAHLPPLAGISGESQVAFWLAGLLICALPLLTLDAVLKMTGK